MQLNELVLVVIKANTVDGHVGGVIIDLADHNRANQRPGIRSAQSVRLLGDELIGAGADHIAAKGDVVGGWSKIEALGVASQVYPITGEQI